MIAPDTPELVAHRGWASRFPENSLEGLAAAFEAGARYAEFDVQLSADGVPVLLHDATLDRTSGTTGCVHDLPWSTLSTLRVGEPARFGPRYSDVRLPSLDQALALLEDWPDRKFFVEIKTESLQRFGIGRVLSRSLDIMARAASQCIVTCYSDEFLVQVRQSSAFPVAWVLTTHDPDSLSRARELAPEYLFCNIEKLPREERLAVGSWRWAIYDITDPDVAMALAGRGVSLVETMAIGEMLLDPRLKEARA